MPRPVSGPHAPKIDGQTISINALSKPIHPVWISCLTGTAYPVKPEVRSMEIWTNLSTDDINRRSKQLGTVYFGHSDKVLGWARNISEKQQRGTGTSG